MSTMVRTPRSRTCERCGREEQWDEDVDAWQLLTVDGEKQAGDPHCIHEWDINGTFNPLAND